MNNSPKDFAIDGTACAYTQKGSSPLHKHVTAPFLP